MSGGQVRIKVYSRVKEGTILYWNTDCLSEEQQANYRTYLRLPGDDNWIAASIGTADLTKMKPMDYSVIGVTMIMHDKDLTEFVPFEVKMTFGTTEMREASLMVEAKNLHQPYVKPVKVGEQWALPVVVIGDLRQREDK
jgi:hypothetical protein